MQKEIDILIIGAGPAGLGAAIESAGSGANVLIMDENILPGGQLFKQIHKFFGSEAHFSGVRGFEIGNILLQQAKEAGVEIKLNSRVLGLLEDGSVPYQVDEELKIIKPKKTIIAVGGKENTISFPGWTLPGVMTAGAAQTMINVNHTLPGRKFLMVGSGNVGLIVSYHLIQAGAELAGIIDIAHDISGYRVHADKIKREEVPVYLNSQIIRASGSDRVESALISGNIEFDVDSILLAVGLSPLTDLAALFGCRLIYSKALGGFMPLHNKDLRTSNFDVYVCGDAAGIEE
ncbi:MAG: FAD-dependent oxidoreductase, partial [Spirochaetales bacterium]|nr:FAD-dependent oxidoreductase [Spirochaetales bacterium]